MVSSAGRRFQRIAAWRNIHRFERFSEQIQLCLEFLDARALRDHDAVQRLQLVVEKGEARLEVREPFAVALLGHQRILMGTPCSARYRLRPE